MNLKNLRIELFYRFLPNISSFFRKRRAADFLHFIEQTNIKSPVIIDLGGTSDIWEFINKPFSITILNLPGHLIKKPSLHNVNYVEGDACDLNQFKNKQFDIVFSNSVIEHVGDKEKQKQFAKETMRVGKYLWVQTPSRLFPIEPHSGMLFWFFYPEFFRRYLMCRWKKKLPKWSEMVKTTSTIKNKELKKLFPGHHIMTERFMGIPKSYIVRTSLSLRHK